MTVRYCPKKIPRAERGGETETREEAFGDPIYTPKGQVKTEKWVPKLKEKRSWKRSRMITWVAANPLSLIH